MDPSIVFCPNLKCPARGQTGQGNTRYPLASGHAVPLHGVP